MKTVRILVALSIVFAFSLVCFACKENDCECEDESSAPYDNDVNDDTDDDMTPEDDDVSNDDADDDVADDDIMDDDLIGDNPPKLSNAYYFPNPTQQRQDSGYYSILWFSVCDPDNDLTPDGGIYSLTGIPEYDLIPWDNFGEPYGDISKADDCDDPVVLLGWTFFQGASQG